MVDLNSLIDTETRNTGRVASQLSDLDVELSLSSDLDALDTVKELLD